MLISNPTSSLNKTFFTYQKQKIIPFLEKKEKLISLLDSVLNNPVYKSEFNYILKLFNLNRKDIMEAFLDYNMDVHSHDNEIYQSQAIRVVLHVHNLIKGSWHIERQKAVCRFIKKANPSKAIDLGFGVPSLYIKKLLSNALNFHLTLCDKEASAFIFAQELLNIWNSRWSERISFLCTDMEKTEQCVSDYDLYIALHSIEHVFNPTRCLSKYVELSLPNSLFLIEIPIGPITPEHYMSWENVDKAIDWLNDVGLDIIDQHFTRVNPNIDLFAEPHQFNYGGFLVLCRRKINV